jgi:hypothetical protein
VCGSTTARQAGVAAASKSSRASSAAATDGDPLVRVPADAYGSSNRRAWALRTCSTWAATAAVDMVTERVFAKKSLVADERGFTRPGGREEQLFSCTCMQQALSFAANKNKSEPPLAAAFMRGRV